MVSALLLVASLGQPTATEVTFEGAGGLQLKGALMMPAVSGDSRAVLLLAGSGPTDRDGNSPLLSVKVDLLKQIAERLAADGIASLRYDKRSAHTYLAQMPKTLEGIGEYAKWANFVDDAKAALAFLKAQQGVDANRVGLVGHSEGGLLTLQVAKDLPSPARPKTIVTLAGPGRRMDEVLMEQLEAQLPKQLPADQVPIYLDYAKKAIEQVKADGTIPPNPPLGLTQLFNPSTLPLLRTYFTLEPTEVAIAYLGPALVMNGEFDAQVSAEKDAKKLEEAFKRRPQGMSELFVVPGGSHNFKSVSGVTEAGFEGPVLPGMLDKLSSWLREKL